MELLLPLVGIALLWFLLIRPTSRRQKELARMQSAIAVGDEVMLTSGVFGTVTALEDDRASLEVATGVVISVARGAIGQVVAKPEDTAEPQQAVEPDAHPTDKSTGVDAGAEEN